LSLLKRDPDLVDSRLKDGPGAERDKSQKIIPGFSVPLSEGATTPRNRMRAMKVLEI
jgi:hypothetical protein